mmetsp:Transcript_28634/g.38140  ORF Transcript_28634/g.38140 Transcript_28634/m.38140 type:complete len:126 (+) Transcript_28634:146-523(+)
MRYKTRIWNPLSWRFIQNEDQFPPIWTQEETQRVFVFTCKMINRAELIALVGQDFRKPLVELVFLFLRPSFANPSQKENGVHFLEKRWEKKKAGTNFFCQDLFTSDFAIVNFCRSLFCLCAGLRC